MYTAIIYSIKIFEHYHHLVGKLKLKTLIRLYVLLTFEMRGVSQDR
jgi:hypothetical protein